MPGPILNGNRARLATSEDVKSLVVGVSAVKETASPRGVSTLHVDVTALELGEYKCPWITSFEPGLNTGTVSVTVICTLPADRGVTMTDLVEERPSTEETRTSNMYVVLENIPYACTDIRLVFTFLIPIGPHKLPKPSKEAILQVHCHDAFKINGDLIFGCMSHVVVHVIGLETQ